MLPWLQSPDWSSFCTSSSVTLKLYFFWNYFLADCILIRAISQLLGLGIPVSCQSIFTYTPSSTNVGDAERDLTNFFYFLRSGLLVWPQEDLGEGVSLYPLQHSLSRLLLTEFQMCLSCLRQTVPVHTILSNFAMGAPGSLDINNGSKRSIPMRSTNDMSLPA